MQTALQLNDEPTAAAPVNERIDLYCEHAKEKRGLPANWRIYKWECFPKGAGETIYVAVTGAVCEHFKKGTAHRNWRLLDKTTECTVNLPVAEHEVWKLQWEKRTGKCHECVGTGEVFAGWSAAEGTRFRGCSRCKGSGSIS